MMEESSGAQYALQVALQTLRDRCQQFQKRISDLESENLNLRSSCRDNIDLGSLPDIDNLRLQIAQLTEEKLQLCKKVEMVSAENNNLWAHLSKLTQVKDNLDSKLTKINDTISSRSYHTNLVRSKKFMQDESDQGNIHEESEKISLELEDISLKLLDNIAREKQELEMQCSQMTEIQNNNNNLFGNSYAFVPSGEEVTECDQLEKQFASLQTIKFILLKQKEKLETVKTLIATKTSVCPTCKIQKSSTSTQTVNNNKRSSITDEENAQLHSLLKWGTPENSLHNNRSDLEAERSKGILNNDNIKICPICSKIFYNNIKLSDFQLHVEQHFILESDADYEII